MNKDFARAVVALSPLLLLEVELPDGRHFDAFGRSRTGRIGSRQPGDF
jgi:hypothetical protein